MSKSSLKLIVTSRERELHVILVRAMKEYCIFVGVTGNYKVHTVAKFSGPFI